MLSTLVLISLVTVLAVAVFTQRDNVLGMVSSFCAGRSSFGDISDAGRRALIRHYGNPRSRRNRGLLDYARLMVSCLVDWFVVRPAGVATAVLAVYAAWTWPLIAAASLGGVIVAVAVWRGIKKDDFSLKAEAIRVVKMLVTAPIWAPLAASFFGEMITKRLLLFIGRGLKWSIDQVMSLVGGAVDRAMGLLFRPKPATATAN